MSLTLDAVENNGLSPSLRRGAREGYFRDLCILTSHAEGDSHGSFVPALLRDKSSITACVSIAQSGKPLKHIRRFVHREWRN
jgi:hypothetical protein